VCCLGRSIELLCSRWSFYENVMARYLHNAGEADYIVLTITDIDFYILLLEKKLPKANLLSPHLYDN
jgi:hypothetical protein